MRVLFFAFVLFNLALFARSTIFYGQNIKGTDGQMYYAFVRSLIIDQDLNFENEFTQFTPNPEHLFETYTTSTGYRSNKYTIGYGIMSIPFFVVAHAITLVGNHFGLSVLPADGYSFWYDIIVPLGHVIYGLLGFYFGYLFLRERFSPQIAALSMGTIWFSTSLLYYSTIFLTMTHSAGFFCINLAHYLALRVNQRYTPSRLATLGLVAGMMVILRPSNIVFLVYPLFAVVSALAKEKPHAREKVLGIAVAILATLSIVSLQLFAWKSIYGRYILFSYEGEGFNWSSPQILNVMFSTNHGLFLFSPVAAIAICGLAIDLLRQRTFMNVGLTISLVLLFYINAAWHNWWFGQAFGARAFCEAGLAFAYGYAVLCSGTRARFACASLLSILLVGWNLYLLTLFVFRHIPAEGTFEFLRLFPFL